MIVTEVVFVVQMEEIFMLMHKTVRPPVCCGPNVIAFVVSGRFEFHVRN